MQILVTGANYRRHRAAGLPGFNAQALEQGQRPRQVIREAGRVAAPPEIGMRLQIDEGVPVVVRRRIFLLEEQPAALTDSYYPTDMAGGRRSSSRAGSRGECTRSSRIRTARSADRSRVQ